MLSPMQTDTRQALGSSAALCACVLAAVAVLAYTLGWVWACALASTAFVTLYMWTAYQHSRLLESLCW